MSVLSQTGTESVLANFADAAALEQALGCPFDPDSGMSLDGGLRADEQETVPTAAFEAAWAAGCHEYLVPVGEGGRLASFESLLAVVRAMSRRELAISVGLGSTFLAATPVWIWGDDAQRKRVAELVLDRRFGTAGVSEDAAGSDLLATSTRAVPVPGGFALHGRKWLVGNGRRSAFAAVLAASEPSYGLFFVDFDAVDERGVQRLPKVRTLGLRGHDLSGFEFDDARIGADARIGRPGRGVELVSGMLQYTRTMVGGMSLGAADTALRIALRHARERVLYGEPAMNLAPVRALLARGFADLLAAECTELAAARGLDVAPQRMALWSAVAKYVVPGFCIDVVNAAGEVLSARAYLREGVAGGAFQKLARDAAITPVFEGTSLVQLETIHSQLVSGARRRGPAQLPLPLLFGFGGPVPDWTPGKPRPSLIYGSADEVVDLLDDAVERLAGQDPGLAALARPLIAARNQAHESPGGLAAHRTAAAYEAARRHALVHAGACCVHTWLERREALGGIAADPAWLRVALRRIAGRLGLPVEPDREAEDRLALLLAGLDDEDRAFSLVPLRLAAQYRGPVRSTN
ncbi:MAG TPA: acyl-CoA dehydrogenase [Actinocrinis sp.]|uniref:acyl-CoA dehydrogenase n=1 Tax=Actinocrinis sp. TaxID=1920516 RepID=UPI002DDD55DE|nr:acyl-CoA dehydrogenase [Actinocrinis sp.]HEV2345918.1 acyl-CoA dehydrogenase [Actinocrinis sp.]